MAQVTIVTTDKHAEHFILIGSDKKQLARLHVLKMLHIGRAVALLE